MGKNPTEFIDNHFNSVCVCIIIGICLAMRLHHNYRQLPNEPMSSEKENEKRKVGKCGCRNSERDG